MYRIALENASKILGWITEGRGVKVWKNICLGSSRGDILTPGDLVSKPNWRYVDEGILYSKIEDFEVEISKEVKRFRVGMRLGTQGLSYKVTAGGCRRINKYLNKFEKSWYRFDYNTQECVIMQTKEIKSLIDIVKEGGITDGLRKNENNENSERCGGYLCGCVQS